MLVIIMPIRMIGIHLVNDYPLGHDRLGAGALQQNTNILTQLHNQRI